MQLPQAHQNLFAKTSALAAELKYIQNQIQKKEDQLKKDISALTHAVRSTASIHKSEATKDALARYFTDTEQVLKAWGNKVASYDAGLSFREKFGDSLLVFVYGKVKAGKSSLGNYVATGVTQLSAEQLKALEKIQQQPEFFLHENNTNFSQEISLEQGFAVGDVETTSSIQGFKKPGLTWIDSPGLHSTNTENGDLAAKYVEAADLIIYPMNSAQPGRESDLAELKELLQVGKRILVLIARCDEIEVDVNDDGEVVNTRVMKSEAKRQDQESYVQKKLDELCTELGVTKADTAVHSISVSYAEEGNNSEQSMQDSGMQALFSKLESILQSEGIELKKQVPEKNLNSFYQLLIQGEGELSLSTVKLPLEGAREKLKTMGTELEDIKEQALGRINLNFANEVDKLVEQFASSKNISRVSQELSEVIERLIAKHYRQPVKEKYQEALQLLVTTTESMALTQHVQFKDNYQDIEFDVTKKRKAIGSGLGSVVGGVAGFFIAGPLGSAIGATAGGLTGGVAGGFFTSKETKNIRVGDNREEVKDQLIKAGQEKVEVILDELHQGFCAEIIEPIDQSLKKVINQITDFQNKIKR